jgi:hypothetical protein
MGAHSSALAKLILPRHKCCRVSGLLSFRSVCTNGIQPYGKRTMPGVLMIKGNRLCLVVPPHRNGCHFLYISIYRRPTYPKCFPRFSPLFVSRPTDMTTRPPTSHRPSAHHFPLLCSCIARVILGELVLFKYSCRGARYLAMVESIHHFSFWRLSRIDRSMARSCWLLFLARGLLSSFFIPLPIFLAERRTPCSMVCSGLACIILNAALGWQLGLMRLQNIHSVGS